VHTDQIGAADGPVTRSGREPTVFPIGARGGWGLVAWEKTRGDLLSEGGYSCAAYGKWHVGEGPGRWPTDKGFDEWYGPPRTYDEALWPQDPRYDPGRDPVTRMVQISRGEHDVRELDQLTLDVRRDCDKLIGEFQISTKREPPIPARAPLEFKPDTADT
jgi:arylsulfatase A-like enzyme